MLFDSGAWLTLISNKIFDEQFSNKVTLKDPDIVPGGYGGQTIDLRGYFEAEITFQTNKICGKVYVPVKGDSVVSWPHQRDLRVILDPNSPSPVMIKEDYVNSLHRIDVLQVQKKLLLPSLVEEFKEVFSGKLGYLTKYSHQIKLKKGSIPVASKVRPVPISLKDDVEKEIKRLCDEDIIEPVESAELTSEVEELPEKGIQRDISVCMVTESVIKQDEWVRVVGEDKILQRVCEQIKGGWRFEVKRDKDLVSFWRVKNELSMEDGILLRGLRGRKANTSLSPAWVYWGKDALECKSLMGKEDDFEKVCVQKRKEYFDDKRGAHLFDVKVGDRVMAWPGRRARWLSQCEALLHISFGRSWRERNCALLVKSPRDVFDAPGAGVWPELVCCLRGRACRRPRPRAQFEGRADAEARSHFWRACGPGVAECLGADRRLSQVRPPAAPGRTWDFAALVVAETFPVLAALGFSRRCGCREHLTRRAR
ncbi:hypothetical protein NDU88_007615 [Pleurodeles waltl]|uniref:Peptidase A2 domain-containing protein n=1 Tax=Pleurodeles waltl TaxID=8319 RepID=A0AAV7STF1_PLEWA|nr:hypothetical protein NDU88_007615 [Pleurodeles waltl]